MSRTRLLLVVLLTFACVGLGVGVVRAGDRPTGGERTGSAAPTAHDEVAHDEAAQVLRHWDARRAAAYASGSVDGLRRLYVPGSAAGAADVRLLRRYAARGLRVEGLREQVLALTVLERSDRRWRLRVTDRVAAATVWSVAGTGERTPLPRDAADTRVLTLVRASDGWRVEAVSPG